MGRGMYTGTRGSAAPSLLKASTATPRMHKGGQDTRGLSDCGTFLHPIQPLAHEGLAQHILFDIHKMSGPIEHSEGRSGAVVQKIPAILVATDVLFSSRQTEPPPSTASRFAPHVK